MGDVPQHEELQKIEREFQRDVTITAARPKVVHFGLFVWLLVDVALVVFFFVSVVLYLVSGAFADQRLMATLDNNVAALHDAKGHEVQIPCLSATRACSRTTSVRTMYLPLWKTRIRNGTRRSRISLAMTSWPHLSQQPSCRVRKSTFLR